ncbi:MAG: hypothetical protein KAT71_06690 [Gammaproteobacteria bacterium]|nr:hypothetical protein [Gammaproteobacteria bacterium]
MTIAKQLLIMLVLTIAAVFCVSQLGSILSAIGYAQAFLAAELIRILPKFIFTHVISEVVALMIIPIIFGIIIPFFYGALAYKEVLKPSRLLWAVWVFLLLIFVMYQ